MTKIRVLEILAEADDFVPPDHVVMRLQPRPQRTSVYSYLSRLHRQGLLVRDQRWGQIVYRLSDKGLHRLKFLMQRENKALFWS